MPDNLNDDTSWRQGEHYDETMSEEPFHEEELDTEEAEQRITQFIMSAEKLPGPLVEELAERVTALMHVAGPASSRIAAARPRTVAPARGKHATEWDRCQRRSELKKYKIAHTYSRSQHVVLTTRSKALRSASLSEQLPDGMLAGEGESIR